YLVAVAVLQPLVGVGAGSVNAGDGGLAHARNLMWRMAAQREAGARKSRYHKRPHSTGQRSMFENDYLLAWAIYAIAALGLLLVWVRITRWMWRWLREPLWLAVAILLFTPTLVDPARDMLAPAIAIAALD